MPGGGKCRLLLEGGTGLQVADAAPLLSSQALPLQLHTIHTSNHLHHHLAVGARSAQGAAGQKPLGQPSASDGTVYPGPLPCPSGGKTQACVFRCLPEVPAGLPPDAHSGDLPFLASFPSLLLPAINSQISYLASNPCLGAYFW